MARVESFEIFCPYVEKIVGVFFFNRETLAAGKKFTTICPESPINEEGGFTVVEEESLMVSKEEGSRLIHFDTSLIKGIRRGILTFEGKVNQTRGDVGVEINCSHCGNIKTYISSTTPNELPENNEA